MTMERVRQPELMDDPALPGDAHRQALAGLRRLNWASGAARQMYAHLMRFARRQSPRPLRVLDVASGGGDLPIAWARWAKRAQVPLHIATVDVSQTAIDIQTENASRYGVELQATCRDCLTESLPDGFDVATCSLFMHHLDDAQAARLLQSMQMSAGGLLINDLDRSRLNLGLVWLGSRLLSRSEVVHHDALTSIRAAYTRDEFQRLAEKALARPVQSSTEFPSRFLIRVEEVAIPVVSPAFA